MLSTLHLVTEATIALSYCSFKPNLKVEKLVYQSLKAKLNRLLILPKLCMKR